MVQVLSAAVLVSASEVAKKIGADSAKAQSVVDVSQLRSPWVWLSVILGILGLLCWLNALRKISLSVAYNLAGLQLMLVPLGSWWLLGEHIGPKQWLGIALVFLGVIITAPAAAHAEEDLEGRPHP